MSYQPRGGNGPILQNIQDADYTTVLTDAQKHIYRTLADTTSRTWIIAANTTTAYPLGTAITFVNGGFNGDITIQITDDILVLAGTGSTGSRTLSTSGIATALKIASNRWLISGTGLT